MIGYIETFWANKGAIGVVANTGLFAIAEAVQASDGTKYSIIGLLATAVVTLWRDGKAKEAKIEAKDAKIEEAKEETMNILKEACNNHLDEACTSKNFSESLLKSLNDRSSK